MTTVFDYLTMAIFAGLIVLFLQRSVDDRPASDALWQYLVASVGCAVANYLGNNGYPIPAVGMVMAVLVFIHYILKPFGPKERP
jgi:hypothetical protein